MLEEHARLYRRIESLRDFVISNRYKTLPEVDQQDLQDQLGFMEAYYHVLNRRVSRHCGEL